MRIAALTVFVCATVVAAAAARTVSQPTAELLFTRGDASAGKADLYAINSDGSGLRLVVRHGSDAAPTHDGRSIAFVRSGSIWIMARDTTGQHHVTTPPRGTSDRQPVWSPDGSTLYFSRYIWRTMSASIFSVRRDGSALRQLTHAPVDTGIAGEGTCDTSPSVSPDGRTIVYTVVESCVHGTGNSIATITTLGKRAHPGFRFPNATFIQPEYLDAAWAPMGYRIAYGVLDYTGAGFTGVYVSAVGKRPQRVAATRGGPGGPPSDFSQIAWSPDGKWLAAARWNYGYGYDLWLVDIAHRVLLQVPGQTSADDSDPAWLP